MEKGILEEYVADVNDLLNNVVKKLCENKHKGLIIKDNNKVVGTFTRQDLVKCSHCFGFSETKVDSFINRSFDYCVNEYNENGINQNHSIIPVVNDEMELISIVFPEKKEKKHKYNYPVVIMAGGKGTRLLPMTKILPKPLVPIINDTPMVEMIINSFRKYKTNRFYMIVNYKKEMIKDYFNNINKEYNLKFVEENQFLGTGGGLKYVEGYLDETFFLTNCDILMLEDYDEVYEFHKRNNNAITMVVSLKSINVPYGVIKIDENQCIINTIEKPTYMTLVNTGIYIVEPEVFNYIDKEETIDFPTIVERMKNDGEKTGIYPITYDKWLDMGQVDELNNSIKVLNKILKEDSDYEKQL